MKNSPSNKQIVAVILAFMAAAFYAVNVPASKVLLEYIDEVMMAGFLYIGAGIGILIVALLNKKDTIKKDSLGRKNIGYVIGMIVLDIAAPIFLMLGVKYGSSANASLLGNFEIVATSLIALLIFKEFISKKLWIAIILVTISSAFLSFDGSDSFKFSIGSLFVLLAATCWGFENNCTRNISDKNTYQIVILKGIFSGLGSLIIAIIKGASFPAPKFIALAMLLGFVSYGLSIFMYVRAQNTLGAAKTSSYYAVAPFIGTLLSFVFLREPLGPLYFIGLVVMIVGTVFIIIDTLKS